eukprot:gnl/TRDRNA2_/TRDRNA2_36669_c0_seq1.p1 gnl/TRDRNA2_/TRDRNA2_36669_c0~~gnl/TRDRNA2_/TRDRNA2_36669_c0_seq1.p1  ORF type:complete len:367 (+),score=69.11 gnl/TRDRNA2_/TRDRNA2_36669_c0_seq1:130-1101(+)
MASEHQNQARALMQATGGNRVMGNQQQLVGFASDVGRKKFGFSHEELDDSSTYYEGQFKLYQRCGEGTLHSPETGAKYIGQFQNDRFHGEGEQIYSDGSKYKGQWRAGQKTGYGEYVNAGRLAYVGQWEDGRRQGQGYQQYANGDLYEGWWFHGMQSGIGTYYFADGSRYEGAWANGRYDGAGVLHSTDGSCERHWYSGGLLMKREVMRAGSASKVSLRRGVVPGKAVFGQTREDMHKPTTLPKLPPSKYLIRRETAGMDLTAAPLLPKCLPAPMAEGDPEDVEVEPPGPPSDNQADAGDNARIPQPPAEPRSGPPRPAQTPR